MLTTTLTGSVAPTGAASASVRPINEGQEVTLVAEHGLTGWGALDGVVTSVSNGLSAIAEAAAQVKINELVGGPATAPTNAGDPEDGPANITPPEKTFLQQYGVALGVGFAGLVGLYALYRVTR